MAKVSASVVMVSGLLAGFASPLMAADAPSAERSLQQPSPSSQAQPGPTGHGLFVRVASSEGALVVQSCPCFPRCLSSAHLIVGDKD